MHQPTCSINAEPRTEPRAERRVKEVPAVPRECSGEGLSLYLSRGV